MLSVDASGVGSPQDSRWSGYPISSRGSQFVNLEEGTSGQLPTGHRNGTNTEVSGHIQRGTPDNSGVEVQGISSSSSGRESTRPFYGKALLHWKKILSKVWPLVNISPFIWCANKISIEPFFLYETVINYDRKCVAMDNTLATVYLQLQTNRSEMIRQKKQEIEQSKSFEKLPENLQKQIKRYHPEKWEETKGGVEFGNLFNNLPDDLRRNIKLQLCLELLKTVEEFRRWSEELLHELCDCVKPVSYAEHAEIVRKGSSIDEMLFLVQGKLRTYSLTSVDTGSAASPPRFETSINHLEDGKFCGEELIAWFQDDLYSSNLPISTRTIQTTTKVDAFALMYYDLQNVFIKHQIARSTSTEVQEPLADSQPPQAPPPPAESLVQQPTSGI
ncbi:hypothetical protein QYF36_010928 [Acer negundo]|nr:hypothetical protein QYF36_010928 [Acer negundo]